MKKLLLLLLTASAIHAEVNNKFRLLYVPGLPAQLRVANLSDTHITFQVQWSTNMVNWQTSPSTNTLPPHTTNWLLLGAGDHPVLFFRTIQLP